jgi:hypothetical protein
MNKDKLTANLNYLVDKYIIDEKVKGELQEHINNHKAKFVLGEINRNKTKDYTDVDKEIIKDIYFYYC